MRTRFLPIVLAACTGQSLASQPPVAAESDAARGITLEQIMADREWLGRPPTNPRWTLDGRAVMYDRARAGSAVTDRYVLVPGEEPRVLSDEERATGFPLGGDLERPNGRRVFAWDGDVYLADADGTVAPVTLTSGRESSPAFVTGRDAIRYRTSGGWMIHDLGTGALRSAANVRFEDAPEPPEDPEGFLAEQQRRLFDVLAEQAADRAERDDLRRAREAADPDRVPGPFYLGDGLESIGSSLATDAQSMLVWASKRRGGSARRDVMPSYVTDDGYVGTRRVRPKVGVEDRRGQRLFLLDLRDESHVEIDLGVLPEITADRFAFLEEPDADAERADEDAPEPTARPVSVLRSAWSRDGRFAALMLESTDNKDRWIVVVDRDEPEALIVVEHLHDPAWINWAFNEMGFLRHSPTGERVLWFLSEKSGYSHLHTWSPGDDAPAVRTSGEFELSSVVEHPLNGSLYFRMNRESPVEYEIACWLWNGNGGGVLDAVTDLGGTVESFQLSPTGDALLMRWSSAIEPPDLYVTGAEPQSPTVRVTDTVSDLYRGLPWIEPEIVPVRSSVTGRDIWTKVYRVDGAWQGEGDPPGVVFVHGAGYTQNSDDQWPYYFREQMFHSMLAYRGYVVADPDYRASAGYGRDWRTAIYRRMGEPELEDLRDVVAWMGNEHGVDTERVGVYGGSYGGFMTLYAMFRDPQLFACGAALRPVTDWAHYNHGYTSNILNTPRLDPEAFDVSSPIEFAEGLENPLLICHGMLDDNVVFQDTVRLAQRLIELGKTDWEVAMYPLEPHGFVHHTSWLDQYRRIDKLFRDHLEAE